MTEITIDLLRHGDVAGGTKLLGSTDEPLSELGWQQLRSVLNGDSPPWNLIISSPLQRCHAFAKEISEQYALPLIVEPRLKEIGFGTWEGMLFQELYNGAESERVKQFWNNPSTNPAPGGETYENFEERVFAAWETILMNHKAEGGNHSLVVAHGGVIRTILRRLLDFPTENFFRIDVPYACLSRIQQNQPMPPRLIFHGGSL